MDSRGKMTDEIQNFMEGFLLRPTSLGELRLIPYLQYQMVNEQRLDPIRINQEERDILSLLRAAGHIDGGASGLGMTKEYWDFCNAVLWMAYVNYQ